MVGTSNQSVPKMAIALLKNGSVIWHPNTPSIHRISSSHCGYAGPAGQPQGPWAAPTRSPRSDTFRPSHSAAHAWVPRGPNEKMDGSMDIHRYIYIYTYIYICIQLIWELKISGISTLVQSYICLETMFLYYVCSNSCTHYIFFTGVWSLVFTERSIDMFDAQIIGQSSNVWCRKHLVALAPTPCRRRQYHFWDPSGQCGSTLHKWMKNCWILPYNLDLQSWGTPKPTCFSRHFPWKITQLDHEMVNLLELRTLFLARKAWTVHDGQDPKNQLHVSWNSTHQHVKKKHTSTISVSGTQTILCWNPETGNSHKGKPPWERKLHYSQKPFFWPYVWHHFIVQIPLWTQLSWGSWKCMQRNLFYQDHKNHSMIYHLQAPSQDGTIYINLYQSKK